MAERIDRLTRVNELIKRELAGLVERLTPPAPNMLISVTEVSASVDLRNATVGISIFGGEKGERAEVFRLLASRRADFQRHLARTLAFKHTPVLTFKPDLRLEQGDRVLELLNQAEKADHDPEAGR